MRNNDWTRILGWPGYRVYRSEINEQTKTLRLWVRRKSGERKLCSSCGQSVSEIAEVCEREIRDLPCFEYQTTVVIEVYRLRCPDCGVKSEKVAPLPSKAPFSKRFEGRGGGSLRERSGTAGGQAGRTGGEHGAVHRPAISGTLGGRRKPGLRQLGVDEIHVGKKQKFLTVARNLESGEPLWFGRERKKETLDEFFQGELSARQRRGIEAACVDMWEPYRQSIEQWAPESRIVYDKFHVMQHANRAVDEVRRAEFFRKGGRMRGLVKGKRWLLLTRWVNLTAGKRRQLNELFRLNRRLLKAYLLKESLDRLWGYRYEGAMVRYFKGWMDQLRWQRLLPFQKLAEMLLDHFDGILNYCRTKVALGVVEAINGNIKTLLRRGRGYRNLRYLLLKAQRLAATKIEFVAFEKAA